jgi:hypothetical protein
MSGISSAINDVQRPANDAAQARKVQLRKNDQHSEEIEDLDENTVESVDDQKQGGSQQQDGDSQPEGDRVEIESIVVAEAAEIPVVQTPTEIPHLDISA